MAKASIDLLSELFDARESLDCALLRTHELSADDYHLLFAIRRELHALEMKLDKGKK